MTRHRVPKCKYCGGNLRIDDHHPNCPEMVDGTPDYPSTTHDRERDQNYPREWTFQ